MSKRRRTIAIVLAVVFAVLWWSAVSPNEHGQQTAPSLVVPCFAIALGCTVWAVIEARKQ